MTQRVVGAWRELPEATLRAASFPLSGEGRVRSMAEYDNLMDHGLAPYKVKVNTQRGNLLRYPIPSIIGVKG